MTIMQEWMEPGVYEVAPGVHRIPLPLPDDGLAAVNAYAIADGAQLALIDPGWGLTEAREQLEAALKQLGAGFGDVSRFLVTHQHRDHYTQAVLLRRDFGPRIALGAAERPALEQLSTPRPAGFFAQYERLVAAGAAELAGHLRERFRDLPHDPADWALPDAWLADGEPCPVGERTLTTIATPGHTRGHVVFRDAAGGLLFAGDHVLPHITPSIAFEVLPPEQPLRDFLDSLALVRALPDTRLLPAHGPVTDSAHARVDELLEHHRTRLDAIEQTVIRGAVTALAAARMITWTRRGRSLDELNGFNRMLAILETAVHLDLLAAQGRITRTRVDGVDHYGAGQAR
jgi:glyoxylase-like metal-dependent hydrolase (beta-lactamase superfamily II)